MTAVFPSNLYRRYVTGTWSEKRRSNFMSFDTDSGVDLRSKIPGSAKTDCGMELVLYENEFSDLEAFYVNDCVEGSVGFTMEHPRRKTACTFMWAEAPSAGHAAGEIYRVPITLIMD
jgi:hypothetical protein